MAVLLSILAVIAVFALASGASPTRRAAPPPPRREAADDDQLDLLLNGGTDADAQRLIEEGVDLQALGYQPPHDG